MLSSDFGQRGLSRPVDAYLRIGEILLDLGLSERELRMITQDNAAFLLTLDS